MGGSRWWPVGAMLALVGIKLWLVAVQPATCYADATLDDRLFINLGWHVAHGDWLGPYDHRTLAKGPMYPIWLAAVCHSRLPLFACQHLLYAAACGLLLSALQPLQLSGLFRVTLFGVILFNPMTWSSESLRVVREGIYPALTLLVLATAIGLYLRERQATPILLRWSVGLGLALAAFWLTREEGVWIVPALCVPLLAQYGSIWRGHRPGSARQLMATMAWLPVFLVGLCSVCSLNLIYYGVFCTVEFKQPDFLRAYGSLVRVKPVRHQQYVPVARETRARIYEVSPAFREVQGFLEGPANDVFSQCATNLKPDEEMAGGWFMWALRDSVALAGHCRSGRESAQYYARLADEVNSACGSGELDCGPARATMRPVWHTGDGALLVRGFLRMLTYIAGFNDCSPVAKGSTGPPDGQRFFAEMIREPVAGEREMTIVSESGRTAPLLRLRVLEEINQEFQFVGPPLAVAALLAWVWSGVLVFMKRERASLFVVTTVLAAGIVSRAILLALVDLSSIPCFNALYPCPAHPLLLAFICLELHAVWRRSLHGRAPSA